MNNRFDHSKYNLKPKHRIMAQHPTINDVLPKCIQLGTVQVKKNVKKFAENGVIFEDEHNVRSLAKN